MNKTWKEDLRAMHRQCGDEEIDPLTGQPTGAICGKSWGHDDPRKNEDPRRRAHFDAGTETIWGLDVEAVAP